MAANGSKVTPQLPNEILEAVFLEHALPSAAIIGRERYETVNVPKGPLIRSEIKNYVDNELYTGACTHQHDEWGLALRTLASLTVCNQRFRQLALPILYKVFPGQTLVKPGLFLKAIQTRPSRAKLVKEMVIDPWNAFHPAGVPILAPDWQYGITYDVVHSFQQHAKEWNDEAYAALLVLHCSSVEVLDLIVPASYTRDSPAMTLFRRLLYHGPNTLARNPEQAEKEKNGITSLPLRQLKALHLHHAEHMYIRSMQYLDALMQIPSAQTLVLYRFDHSPEPLECLRRVQDLTLWRCLIDSAALLKGLKNCTQLRSLSIIFIGGKLILDIHKQVTDVVDYFQLGELIRKRFKLLRKLRLDDRELQDNETHFLGSLKGMAHLTDVAVNESCFGSYSTTGQRQHGGQVAKRAAYAERLPLSAFLPPSVQSLTIFRSNTWWHEADGGRSYERRHEKGLTYHFHAIHDKIFELLRDGLYETPELTAVHLDTPEAFGRDVEALGWKCERVVGDIHLERPSMTGNSLIKPKEKQLWEETQVMRAATPSVLLKRIGRV